MTDRLHAHSTRSLGVIVVTYNAEDVILDCVQSLLNAAGAPPKIVIVDNQSTDNTVAQLRKWAAGETQVVPSKTLPFELNPLSVPVAILTADETDQDGITLIESPKNGGFAAGVNIGLAHLLQYPDIDRFWVLNPDCVVPPQTPAILANHPVPDTGFALMTGRICYEDPLDVIQSDGGQINWKTGVTSNLNFQRHRQDTPDPDSRSFDFVGGAHMVASRQFCEQVGLMPEEYFLYYEEVDWAQRRGDLPLLYCPEAYVYHKAGTSIGSPTTKVGPSLMSLYFLNRSRMRFMRRYRPWRLGMAYGYTLAKALRCVARGQWAAARTLIRAAHGMQPPRSVRQKLAPVLDLDTGRII